MVDRWVLNASPLIALARIGQADLFEHLADQVIVPRAVADEIQIDDDLVREALRRTVGESWSSTAT